MDQKIITAGCALCFATCGLASVAHAAEPTTGPIFEDVAAVKLQPVDDTVLASQSGKGLAGDIISGVVVDLLSQWNQPNGTTAVAQGALAIVTNRLNQVAVQLNSSAAVVSSNDGAGNSGSSGSGNGANPNASATGGQNASVNGVSQITQVAGNGNSGNNQAVIDFNTPLSNVSTGSFNNATSASASNASGSVKAGVSFGSSGISIALQTPAGVATQTIAPGNSQQAGQIAQLLQIAGNNQQVANMLQLHLQTQQMSASMLRQLGVLQALQNTARR